MASVAFPTFDPPISPSRRPSHGEHDEIPRRHILPFRRMSTPTTPSLLHRQSVVSITSVDSTPEEPFGPASSATSPPGSSGAQGLKRKDKKTPRKFMEDMMSRGNGKNKQVLPHREGKEVKRRNVIMEFYDTEKAYVDGLDLIYSHFLTPIIDSLETPTPLLDSNQLTAVFSNFIDIWNFHHSFFDKLTTLLAQSITDTSIFPPPLSPVLLSHFPYVSLYTPFIMSFPNVLASLSSLTASDLTFSAFIARQEADERCGKLKLRDWLLTLVQRCPRYLLLLKDLIACTDPEESEYVALSNARDMLSKITHSLDISLQTHSQTLELLSLQKATQNLPIQLVSPGRTFLKRGTLFQLESTPTPKPREFLLFSDCILWLATDSMLEAEVPPSPITRPVRIGMNNYPRSASPKKVRFTSGSISEEKWWFKGKASLLDLDVVVTHHRRNLSNPEYSEFLNNEEDHRFDILSPEVSFSCYAESKAERDKWVELIRDAKQSLMASLNQMNTNSTLSSSEAKEHLRTRLVAAAYNPEEMENDNEEGQTMLLAFDRRLKKSGAKKPRRGLVEHFVPAIWVPDGKTDICMRCSKPFSWLKRRHHCRLCGRCVCAGCSEQTFFIYDPTTRANGKNPPKSKSERACNICYDMVFPVIPDTTPPRSPTLELQRYPGSTMASFPSWKTTKPKDISPAVSSALMQLDLPLSLTEPLSSSPTGLKPIKKRMSARPLSHSSIPPEFQLASSLASESTDRLDGLRADSGEGVTEEDGTDDGSSMHRTPIGASILESDGATPTTPSKYRSTYSIPNSPATRRAGRTHLSTSFGSNIDEDVYEEQEQEISQNQKNRKRFSLPALAIQTPQIIAKPNPVGKGISKRFSLVLGSGERSTQVWKSSNLNPGNRRYSVDVVKNPFSSTAAAMTEVGFVEGDPGTREDTDLRHGIAAANLTALLQRSSKE